MKTFFLENTSFGDENFLMNSHDNITLIVLAIAARDNLETKIWPAKDWTPLSQSIFLQGQQITTQVGFEPWPS